MKPAQREVPAVVRRAGLHSLRLELGGMHFTGLNSEFAELAENIRKALNDNRIENT